MPKFSNAEKRDELIREANRRRMIYPEDKLDLMPRAAQTAARRSIEIMDEVAADYGRLAAAEAPPPGRLI